MYKKSMIAWTIAVLLFMTSNALSIGEDGTEKETGMVQLTEGQHRELVGGNMELLPAVKIEEHEYLALELDLDRIIIKPFPRCSYLFKEFMEKYRPIFQRWANKNCQTYIGVWRCPYSGVCFIFIVKPYTLCDWKDPIFIPKIPVWEWPQLEIPQIEIPRI